MNQRGANEATGNELLYIVGGVMALCALAYYLFHKEIVHVLFSMKYYELMLISHFSPSYVGLIDWIKSTSTGTVTYQDLKYLALVVGEPLKIPCGIILLLLSAIIYFFHPDATFRGDEDTVSLASKMKESFPAIEVVAELELTKESIDKGPWAMAQTPIEFAKQHKLLYRDPETQRILVDRNRAKVTFTEQLGTLWTGANDLKSHERAIFAALLLYVNYQRDRADALLEQIAKSANKTNLQTLKLDFKSVDEIIAEFAETQNVQAITNRHAYKYGVFAAMLQAGRLTGIVANATYLWLKPTDRMLWYTLNNVGRKAVFIETAATHAHILAERLMGFAIKTPMIDAAVDGLQDAVDIRIIRDL